VALGSIAEKPWVVNGEVKIRQILNLTISMNHDVIDGVPARQFTQDLVNEIESNTSDILR
jgi:pyruvate dehydrogenase E2 component (dihydrolipoamide acetyltransferase)